MLTFRPAAQEVDTGLNDLVLYSLMGGAIACLQATNCKQDLI